MLELLCHLPSQVYKTINVWQELKAVGDGGLKYLPTDGAGGEKGC